MGSLLVVCSSVSVRRIAECKTALRITPFRVYMLACLAGASSLQASVCLHSRSTTVKSHPSEYCNRSGSFLGVDVTDLFARTDSRHAVVAVSCRRSSERITTFALVARKLAYSSAKLGACLSLTIVERRRSCSEW